MSQILTDHRASMFSTCYTLGEVVSMPDSTLIAQWLIARGFALDGDAIVCPVEALPAAVSRLRDRVSQAVAADPTTWGGAKLSASWVDGEPARLLLTGVEL